MIVRPLLAFAVALLATAAYAEPQFLPGSRIGIEPPPGMVASKGYQGFEDREKRVLIVLQELSLQSYDKVENDFAPVQMQAGGMEELARETLALPGGTGLFVLARVVENGTPMRKYALLTRTEDLTAIVIAALPEISRSAYPDAAIRAALASTIVRAKLTPEQMMAVLPYALSDLGGFRLLRATPDGVAVLTLGDKDTTLPVQQPYFLIAPRTVEVPPIAERPMFAQRALMSFVNRPDLRIVNSEPVRIGGAPGHEVIAESKDEASGEDLMTVQWLRWGTAGVVQLFGIARKDQWATVLPRMRALRDGLTHP